MKTTLKSTNRQARGGVSKLAAGIAVTFAAFALQAGVIATNPPGFKIIKPNQGGLSPKVEIGSIKRQSTNVVLEIGGLRGPYSVERKTDLKSGTWVDTGVSLDGTTLTVPIVGDIGFLRVRGQSYSYVGSTVCAMCHSTYHQQWTNTAHYKAYQSLKNIGMHNNAACLPCHTVGYGSGGFVNETSTPNLAGVQCENCHGPGGQHLTNPFGIKPIITKSAMMCGGCHTDSHHPTYDEWSESGHSAVTPTVASYFKQYGESRMWQCGHCHSGSVRDAILSQLTVTNGTVAMPSADDAANTPVTCVTCHESHQVTAFDAQLRHPLYSTNHYNFTNPTNMATFVSQYNPNINLCGQCHNARGAVWTDSSRPPHHSVQYNMLVGTAGYPNIGDNSQTIATHGLYIEKQCAHCHVHSVEVANPTDANPNYTGHKFEVRFESCEECHGSAEVGELLTEGTQTVISNKIQEVVALLRNWGVSNAPSALRNKSGPLAWEYSTIGQLSTNIAATITNKAPTSAEQSQIPAAIRQARFNLYLVEHDGSKGVHNAKYARYLLNVAKTNVLAELAKPPLP
ncbi:MAG: cytochrome c family protein [Verrucomicrobiae bacterium]|nr:cytochrome c family protein [Verrucomicrobiae bacterium]